MIPVIDHALLVVALTGQAFISSDIDRGIWFTGLVQEPVEIGIVFQASIINFMWGGIQRSIPRIKILRRYGFEINEFRDIYGIVNRQQLVHTLDKEDIFYIPWGNQKLLIDKCKGDQQKALFYAGKTIENNWSRAVLLNFLDTALYERQGKALTNFSMTLPAPQSDLAQAMTKDPYKFDFLTIREKYDEEELKAALIGKVEKFLLELGTGFAFMGREVRLEVGKKEKFPDILFYNVKQHCYVVVEVKVVDFDSSFASQLGTYVVAVNHQLKTEIDNTTIGLLICKGMDRVEAQYALESSSQPLGISSYELSRLIPEEFKGSLPTIEEIEAELTDSDEEEQV